MTACALIMATEAPREQDGESLYLGSVLFEPMIDRVIKAARGCCADAIAVLINENDKRLSSHLEENIKVSCDYKELESFIKGFDSVIVLQGNAPLVTEAELIALKVCRETMKDALTVMKGSETYYGIYCFASDALHTQLNAPCDILSAQGIIEKNGGKITSLKSASEDSVMTVTTPAQLHAAGALARRAAIEKAIEGGALIPCTDGVIIADDCTIGSRTVILPGTVILGGSSIGSDCVIGPNSYVESSCVGSGVKFNSSQIRSAEILSGADIGPFVQVRPDSVIGEGVHLGNFVEVKNSVIGSGTKVSHLTYVGDSDVGSGVNFGCGVVTVNYTGKQKHRTKIGDNAFIGCNTNLVAPVEVGKNAYTAAGSTITSDVPANALGIARARQENKEKWVLKKQPYKKKVEE